MFRLVSNCPSVHSLNRDLCHPPALIQSIRARLLTCTHRVLREGRFKLPRLPDEGASGVRVSDYVGSGVTADAPEAAAQAPPQQQEYEGVNVNAVDSCEFRAVLVDPPRAGLDKVSVGKRHSPLTCPLLDPQDVLLYAPLRP